MDFLFSTGIRKLPKIPDKNNFLFFPTKQKFTKEFILKNNRNENSKYCFHKKLNLSKSNFN